MGTVSKKKVIMNFSFSDLSLLKQPTLEHIALRSISAVPSSTPGSKICAGVMRIFTPSLDYYIDIVYHLVASVYLLSTSFQLMIFQMFFKKSGLTFL
jgi:hypothetical protein